MSAKLIGCSTYMCVFLGSSMSLFAYKYACVCHSLRVCVRELYDEPQFYFLSHASVDCMKFYYMI